jgi:Na+/H+ antiporter NhaD/arsenite permease-like protein
MEAAAVGRTIFGFDPLLVSTILLVATYSVIVTEKLNRAIVALLGAGLMISLGLLNQEQAIKGIDFNTLALLTGMMLIVAIAKRSGLFQFLAIVSAKAARAEPAGILLMLAIVTAVLSALLDNVTTVLLIGPVTLVICRELNVNAYPFLFSEIMASNIGGTATLVGDPPNIIIGSAAHLTFMDFVYALSPVIAIILLINAGIIHLIWGRSMTATEESKARIMALDHRDSITDRVLMIKSVAVISLVIIAFVSARALHLEAGTIALFGAAILLLLDNIGRSLDDQHHRMIESFGEVEWITIFFFVGLFIVVAGVEHAGLLRLMAEWLVEITEGDLSTLGVAMLWVSAVLSAIIDNIPFVATMIPVIKNMAPTFGGEEALLPLWWSLSLGACLGGNGTLIGASANLTIAGIGERAGVPFRFLQFAKIAFPLMLLSIAISHVYLAWRYL